MSHLIYNGEFDQPVLRIVAAGRAIEFSLAKVAPEAHNWLAEILDKDINELVDRATKAAVKKHQRELRELLGLKGIEGYTS